MNTSKTARHGHGHGHHKRSKLTRFKTALRTQTAGRLVNAALGAAFACYATATNPVFLGSGMPAVAGMTMLGAVMGFLVRETLVMVVAVVIGIVVFGLFR